ncbi:uncharacterized protein [Spinacia oleracea]|uniref:Uncharacterized protein isoform X2 n=1 Tax=Spinacia oleracea TaxID=3562 RepID=A0ABM3QVQ7_SPIOL|nr:uncharacterized protein LOC110805764 isoform X2 [Spinacia oleracea]
MANSSHLQIFGNKLENVKAVDTEPMDYNMKLADPLLEIQVGGVLNDTEELYSPRSIGDSQTGYDTEVVPDSEDEMTDPVDSKQLVHGRVLFIQRFARGLDKVESPFPPLLEKLECSDINADVCDDGVHVSGQTSNINVFQGNDGCSGTVHHGMLGTDLNANYEEVSKVNDTCLDNAVSCDINCNDDGKKLSEENKDDKCGKISQSNRKDVRIVYTRKRKRTCNVGANGKEDEKRSPDRTDDEYAGLSYVESQEPEDVSKALLFVDKYVGSNVMYSSPVANITVKDKSLSARSVKGGSSLIRWAALKNREEGKRIFEWDDRLDGNGHSDPSDSSGQLSFRSKKYDQKYMRRSESVRRMIPKDIGDPIFSRKEKAEGKNDLTQTKSTEVVYNHINAGMTEKTHEMEANEVSKMLDQQVSEEFKVMQLEAGAVHEELGYAFDVGIDTQMAAEAIQALSYAVPTGCIEVDADKFQHKMLDRPLESRQKRTLAGDWSFPKKVRSASRGVVSRPEESRRLSCSNNRNSEIQAFKLREKRNSRNSGNDKCVDRRISDISPKADVTHKRKVEGAKEVKLDGSKENLRSSVSTKQASTHRVKCRRKDSGSYPDAKTDVKIDLYDKRKRRVNDKSEISDKKKNTPNPLYEKCMNAKDMKASEVVDDSANNSSVDRRNHQMEIALFDRDNKGGAKVLSVSDPVQNLPKLPCTKFNDARSTSTGQTKAQYAPARSTNWYSRDYPRGKRTCKSMLRTSGGFRDFNHSFVRVSGEENGCHHLKGRLDLKGCCTPSYTGSSIKKKRRSSAYISPCRLLSQKNSEQNLVRHNADEMMESGVVSEHLIESTITLQHDKLDDNIDSASTVADKKRKDVPTILCDKNLISEDTASPSNLIDDCLRHGKKKASPSLTRELVRLGFRESIPEFTSKDSRRRKTMAEIQVLLSKSLDERTLLQQKKISTRFGVSMASSPSTATHFVADKFSRTRNMLEFIAQGKPVVSHMWLESCQQAGFYIDETNYILRDIKRERELGFRLPFSLDRARKHPLLKGYRVIITPNTKPGQEMMTSLVEAVHGQVHQLIAQNCY